MAEQDTPNCFQATVRGRVQGVGFRVYTRDCAQRRQVTGWVKNQPDGSVQVYAEGDEMALTDFLTDLYRGPILSHVRDIDLEWNRADRRFQQFEIIR